MFTPPLVIQTKIFATLPESFRRQSATSEWHIHQPGNLPAHSFLEGPVFDSRGNFYCVDIPWGRIFHVTSEGKFSLVAEYDGEPNGLKITQGGKFLIADYKHGIMELDPKTGIVTSFISRVRLERLKAVNDLTLGKSDEFFFTDQGLTGLHDPTGRVFRVRGGGHIDCLISNAPSPNGLVLSPDGSTLYVAMTRANAVWRIPLMSDGTVAKVGLYIQMSGGTGPDGLAMDRSGRLAIAHIGMGVVWILNQRGEPIYRLESCAGLNTTNITFSEDDRQLFITESTTGSILVAEIPASSP